MSLVETSIRRPVFAWMLMLALIVFGAISFQGMGVSQLPDVDFPVVNVSLTLEGAAPEVMEMDVVDPVESAVMSVEGVESVSSSAKSGSANVTVEFGLNKNIDVAVQEVQTKIAQAQRSLPKNIDPPVVTKSNPEDQPIMYMAVSSEKMSAPELMAYVRDNLQDKFTTLPGVSDVFLGGYVDPNLRVWVSQKKLDKYDLTVTDVIGAIAAEHSEPPAGRIETPKQEFNIRTMGRSRQHRGIQQAGDQPSGRIAELYFDRAQAGRGCGAGLGRRSPEKPRHGVSRGRSRDPKAARLERRGCRRRRQEKGRGAQGLLAGRDEAGLELRFHQVHQGCGP